MGKYSNSYGKKAVPPRQPRQTHEIWRGLGCLLMLLIPLISIASAYQTVDWLAGSTWKIIPRQLLGHPRLPDFIYKSSGLVTILNPITKVDNFYAIVAASILYMVLLSGLISLVYSMVYIAVAPNRYGPTDAPPPKIKVTKKSR